MGKDQTKEKQIDDIFFNLRYIGYCTAFMPPEGIDADLKDLLNYAKFQLCQARNILMKDPIWDSYSDEELLVEYFAVLLSNDKEKKDEFATILAGGDPDLLDWFKKMEDQNKKDLEKQLSKQKDELTFNPSDIKG